MKNRMNFFIKSLMERGLTLALAESVTCGLAAHKLSTCIGTSEVLKGSVVCYTPEVKTDLMRVPKKVIEKYSCESEEVTETLARNLSDIISADIFVAITGLASSNGSETKSKPVGTIFICICYKNGVYNLRKVFRGTPLEIRHKACLALYNEVLEKIKREEIAL